MLVTIATWNINSVRLRMPIVEHFLATHDVDVLCLQETKTPDANFPVGALKKLGYEHVAMHGQKGYHGVAVISKRPFATVDRRDFCAKGDARHVGVTVDFGKTAIDLHNLYVPAGGDEPDPVINDKFAHKLAFLDEMAGWIGLGPTANPTIVVGDLNVAPLEHDVWSHKALLNIVSHTPVETEALERIRTGGGFLDVMRRHVPHPEKLYTWWSYRAADWRAANKGRRLDHVWASPDLEPTIAGMEVITEARGWERPSDHVPVIARFEI